LSKKTNQKRKREEKMPAVVADYPRLGYLDEVVWTTEFPERIEEVVDDLTRGWDNLLSTINPSADGYPKLEIF